MPRPTGRAAWRLLAQGKRAESMAALQQADTYIAVLKAEPIDQQQVAWLVSRIERQRARLLAKDNKFAPALASLDMAVASLEGANSEASTFGPTLAETRLERAAMASRAGQPRAASWPSSTRRSSR